jgi:hypothetical protein
MTLAPMAALDRPPSISSFTPGATRVPTVAQQLVDRDEFLVEVHDRLNQAQRHYKDYYDKKHHDLKFATDDKVWLCLLNRLLASLDIKGRGKLGPKFYGPSRKSSASTLWPTNSRCRREPDCITCSTSAS